MEVKLNFIERTLMRLEWALFYASRKVSNIVYKKYDKDSIYRGHSWNPESGVLTFSKRRKES